MESLVEQQVVPQPPREKAGAEAVDDALNRLEIRLAGPSDREALGELAARSDTPVPAGALMVAASDDSILAAVSTSEGGALIDPTPAGGAAAAVLRYTVGKLHRPHWQPRRKGTPS